jgi:hypothetical protein
MVSESLRSTMRRQASTVLAALSLRRNLLFDPEMLFNRPDTDFELEAFVYLILGSPGQ